MKIIDDLLTVIRSIPESKLNEVINELFIIEGIVDITQQESLRVSITNMYYST